MDGFLETVKVGNNKSIHIASLARETVIEAGAEHLGFGGIFLFEEIETGCSNYINVLGKAASYEAALELSDLLQGSNRT